jgi:hypothetical protein
MKSAYKDAIEQNNEQLSMEFNDSNLQPISFV